MADDPNRDLLPVREGSCIDTCRSNAIDPRDRHAVVKLDRYQLEDRYLRMRDEIFELKKLSNAQEDKIKRLATKLMRASATPGSCLETALDFHVDKNRLDNLELENAKLKDKISVLRSQILNHKIGGRSPSRSRRLQICPSSGPTTCRSDLGRIQSSTSQLIRESDRENENKDAKNYLAKIEQLEMEKKNLMSRIESLESEIANHEAGNQRQKVADNVEFIRVWRQMKLQNEELVTSQARNVSLEEQIRDLKNLLDEKSRNIKEITNALLAEKKKFSDMDDQLARAKSSQLTLREKDEQIRDLMNEMKILHQHNAELIALSSKYSNAEIENMELRKKISEQLSDNLSLKSAFNNEQANIAALQAANQQLMTKLHELQTNIDTLTIQLKSLQSQNEKQEKLIRMVSEPDSDRRVCRTLDRQTSTNSLEDEAKFPLREKYSAKREICINCCQASRERTDRPSGRICIAREVQTDEMKLEIGRNLGTRSSERKSPENLKPRSTICDRSFQHENGNLTAEEMIKLLEKAQINTPLDVHNISRIRRNDSGGPKTCVTSSDSSRQSSCLPMTKKSCQSLGNDPWKVLLVLCKILCENVANSSRALEDINSCVCENGDRDENNNARVLVNCCKQEEYCKNEANVVSTSRKIPNDRRSEHRQKIENSKNGTTRLVNQYTEMNDFCDCQNNEICTYEVDCGYPCVPSAGELMKNEQTFDDCQCKISRDNFQTFVSDFSSSIRKTFDNIHQSRVGRVDGTSSGLYKSWQKACEKKNSQNRSSSECDSKVSVCRRARCLLRDEISHEALIEKIQQYGPLRVEQNLSYCQNVNPNENSDVNYFFSINKNCGDGPTIRENESFPILLTDDQGLLEIHIMSLQLTSMANEMFCNERNIKDVSLFVSWDLWNQEKAYTSSRKLSKLNFNSTSIHRVTRLFEFFNQVLGQTISLGIHVSQRGNTSRPIAKARLNIKDILDYPQSKFHYVVNFSSISPPTSLCNEIFGQLSLWVRLDCDLEKIEIFKKHKRIRSRPWACENIEKIRASDRRATCNLDDRVQSISSQFDEFRTNHWKKLDRKCGQIEKRDSITRQENHSNARGSLIPEKISRSSKNFETPKSSLETSSSTLEPFLKNKNWTNNSSERNSNLTTSQKTLPIKKSDPSMTRSMEDEDTTSEEIRGEEKRRETRFAEESLVVVRPKTEEVTDRSESPSVNEFNKLIRTGTILSPKDSKNSVQDLGNVIMDDNWHKYRRKTIIPEETTGEPSMLPLAPDTGSKSSHLYSDTSDNSCDAVIIRIECLTLLPKCPLLDDPKIHQLYVEFSFLGHRGAELETISVPKPAANTKAYFNYMRKFEFDEEEHSTQRNIMRDILRETESPTIVFILVSEPLAEEMETQDCEEVGYAFFNIRDHILRGRSKDVSLTVMNIDRTEPIGTLKITLLGAEPLRRCVSDL